MEMGRKTRTLKILYLDGYPHEVKLTELDMLILVNLPAMQERLIKDLVEVLDYKESTIRAHITKLVRRKWVKRTRIGGKHGQVYLEVSRQAKHFAYTITKR